MKFRKKPIVIEATQWLKHGDHSDVKGDISTPDTCCEVCGKPNHRHGWIQTLEGGHRVCPGDWIITGIKGEVYPVKNDIFLETYENADLTI